MSKSLARVKAALIQSGLQVHILQTPAFTRTAAEAALAAGVSLDQIVKSILLKGASGKLYLFLTAGGNQVDEGKASALAAETLARADAAAVRDTTGFAIGGVSPIGHLSAPPVWMDPRLLDFAEVWAAAGTPNHIFAISPVTLQSLTGAIVTPFTLGS